MRRIVAGLLALCLVGLLPARAQNAPSRAFLTPNSTTIAVTNTFQLVFPADNNRQGCVITNLSTSHAMTIYWDTAAAANSAGVSKGQTLAAGWSVPCWGGGSSVLSNAVSITGTSTDTFFAQSW